MLGGFLKTNIELKELKDATDWFSIYLSPLVNPNGKLENVISNIIETSLINKEKVIKLLQNADFNISDIILEEKDKNIDIRTKLYEIKLEHTVNNNKYELPFNLESEGTQRYYGLAGFLYLIIRTSRGLAIDELESSLHPDLFTHFLLSFLINSKQSQLITTTHNREILNNKDIFRNDAIWITDKSENCSTELYSLADFDTSVIRDTSNIYNAYKIGKLGGIPNLGDYYIDLEE